MRIVQAQLLQVAAKKTQYPDLLQKEIAFAGRSNVGKSSLINLLVNRKDLARVSSTPGKTRTINFYAVEYLPDSGKTGELPAPSGEKTGEKGREPKERKKARIVDLPGYGYAQVSKGESESWGEMIETYLNDRPNLQKVALLVDSRHAPSAQDMQMYEWLVHYGMDGLVIATKCDKLSKNELARNISMIRRTLGMKQEDKVFPVSALKRTGTEELLRELATLWEL